MPKSILWTVLALAFTLGIGTAHAESAQQDPLPKSLPIYDTAVLLQVLKKPELMAQDPKIARAVAEAYSIHIYDMYMAGYMKEHGLTDPPVPFEKIKPLIDTFKAAPYPVLYEAIVNHSGLAIMLPVITDELAKFELSHDIKPRTVMMTINTSEAATELSVSLESFKQTNMRYFMILGVLVVLNIFATIWLAASR